MARKSKKWSPILAGEEYAGWGEELLPELCNHYNFDGDVDSLDDKLKKLLVNMAIDHKIPAFTHVAPYNQMRREVKEMERLVFWVDIQTIMFTENLSLENGH